MKKKNGDSNIYSSLSATRTLTCNVHHHHNSATVYVKLNNPPSPPGTQNIQTMKMCKLSYHPNNEMGHIYINIDYYSAVRLIPTQCYTVQGAASVKC